MSGQVSVQRDYNLTLRTRELGALVGVALPGAHVEEDGLAGQDVALQGEAEGVDRDRLGGQDVVLSVVVRWVVGVVGVVGIAKNVRYANENSKPEQNKLSKIESNAK